MCFIVSGSVVLTANGNVLVGVLTRRELHVISVLQHLLGAASVESVGVVILWVIFVVNVL